MFFKQKCVSCGHDNPRNATTCFSCGAPLKTRPVKPKGLKTRKLPTDPMAEFNETVRLYPQSAEAYYKRGFAYQKQRKQDEALRDFDKAININPDFAKAYSNRGYAYLNKKDFDRAIDDCTKAVKLGPNDAVAYLNRGIAHSLQGDEGAAKADFETVVKLENNPEAVRMARQHLSKLKKKKI